jgi:hypothetical protein
MRNSGGRDPGDDARGALCRESKWHDGRGSQCSDRVGRMRELCTRRCCAGRLAKAAAALVLAVGDGYGGGSVVLGQIGWIVALAAGTNGVSSIRVSERFGYMGRAALALVTSCGTSGTTG